PAERRRAARLARRLRGDLDNVVLMAMRKEPERRYASAAELAEDLRRHRAKLPVSARADTLAYRLGRFARRNRAAVAAAAVAVVIIAAFVVALWRQLAATRLERDRAETLRDTFVELIHHVDPSGQQASSEETLALLDEARRIVLAEGGRPEDRALLLDRLGRAYFRLGFLDRAQELLAESLRLRSVLKPADPVLLAESLNNLALVKLGLGRYDEAQADLRRAMELAAGHEEPGVTLQRLTNLAASIEKRGDYAAAEVIHRQVLAGKLELYDDGGDEVATSRNNLAAVLINQGRYDEAEPLLRRVVEQRRAQLGRDHPKLAGPLMNLALALAGRGQHAEAIASYRRALEVRRRYYDDPDHPAVAAAELGLGFALADGGTPEQLAEAEGLLEHAAGVFRARLGDGHPSTLVAKRNLAAVLLARGRVGEAETLARDVVQRAADAWPAGHWRRADADSVLGACLLARGRRDEAEPLLRAALPAIRQGSGETSIYARQAEARLEQLR
ncbi:MAG: hypothetical protein D6696_07345, partial [Acidobacteria bacterium]